MRFLIYIIALLSLINFNNQSFAEEKIVFLNVNYVFNNSISGKEANKSIGNKIKKLESDVNQFSKTINTEKEKLIKQKNILSEDDFKNKLINIDNKVKEFNDKIKIRKEEINTLQNQARSNFIIELHTNKIFTIDFQSYCYCPNTEERESIWEKYMEREKRRGQKFISLIRDDL